MENFTAVSLAHWIMGDGFWNSQDGTLILCTDSFSLDEIKFLCNLLYTKFGLICSPNRRVKDNGEICYRIRFSTKQGNINRLRELVLPHMYQSFHYRLGI